MVGRLMSTNPISHWWIQKLTSLLLIPLSAWLLYTGVSMAGADYASAVEFMGRPTNALMAVMFTAVALYHATLGIQTIIEDYLAPGLGRVLLMVTKVGCTAGVLAVIAAAFKLSFGA
jgi:succinate dehydrogenase / fumarate reductase membrane anchor subunit